MDNMTNQPMGFKPFDTPSCPGCQQNFMPGGMYGQMQPMTMARPDLMAQMPTGIPQGPDFGWGMMTQQGMMPQQPTQPMVPQAPGTAMMSDSTPIVPWNQPMPVTTESLQYMNGFMRTQIGRRCTVEFLIGTNTLTDKTGTLLAVGANYILLNETESDDILLCDFYSIKFITFYY
ncbi:MAG TPA: hypothetical protein VIL05_15305 [Thermoclostridium sp.]